MAIEVNPTASPALADMDRLNRNADLIGASRRFLISQTHRPTGDGVRVGLKAFVVR